MVECLLAKQNVIGSNPISCSKFYAWVAQLVEYLVANQDVAGSNPVPRSSLHVPVAELA